MYNWHLKHIQPRMKNTYQYQKHHSFDNALGTLYIHERNIYTRRESSNHIHFCTAYNVRMVIKDSCGQPTQKSISITRDIAILLLTILHCARLKHILQFGSTHCTQLPEESSKTNPFLHCKKYRTSIQLNQSTNQEPCIQVKNCLFE